MIRDFAVGDIVELRKQHPCGSYRWEIVRVGADIGLRCLGCERKIMLPRSTVDRRTKQHLDSTGTVKNSET